MKIRTEQKLIRFQGQITALRCYQKVNDSLKTPLMEKGLETSVLPTEIVRPDH